MHERMRITAFRAFTASQEPRHGRVEVETRTRCTRHPPPRHAPFQQKHAEAAFVQWLEACLRSEYQVIDQRFFSGKGESAVWVAIGKGHALYHENENGRWRVLEEIEQDWRSPGFHLVRMWKVNIDDQDRYFVIAMRVSTMV